MKNDIATIKAYITKLSENGTKNFVRVEFDGWYYNPEDVLTVGKELGYTYKIDCCTFRHYAIIDFHK